MILLVPVKVNNFTYFQNMCCMCSNPDQINRWIVISSITKLMHKFYWKNIDALGQISWHLILFIFVPSTRQIDQISTHISRQAYLDKGQLKISAQLIEISKDLVARQIYILLQAISRYFTKVCCMIHNLERN